MRESEKWKVKLLSCVRPQRPHGLQTSRLLHPWDFPGKSTRVGCHILAWRIPGTGELGGLLSMGSHGVRHNWSDLAAVAAAGKNTGVCCHFFLQGTFANQGKNPGPPYCRQTLYHLSHQGNSPFFLAVPNVLADSWQKYPTTLSHSPVVLALTGWIRVIR